MKKRRIKDSWINEYLRYTNATESPEAFHVWTALSVLASALQRRVYIDRGIYQLFPNLYIVLIAGAAKCRKSTSVKIGHKLLAKAAGDTLNLIPDKITPEALILAMQGNVSMEDMNIRQESSACIFASEMAVLFKNATVDNTMITLLTDFWDCPSSWKYQTKTQGDTELHNICINMIAASTPKWFKQCVPEDATGGGFISRVLIVYQDQARRKVAFPDEEFREHGPEMESRLVEDLQQIITLEGEVQIPEEARAWYRNWYELELDEIDMHPHTDYLVRRPDTLLKIATILSVSETDSLVIEKRHMEHALQMINYVRDTMAPAIEQISTMKASDNVAKVVDMFRRFRRLTHADLQRKCWYFAKAAELEDILGTLIDADLIEPSIISAKGKRLYTATDAIDEVSSSGIMPYNSRTADEEMDAYLEEQYRLSKMEGAVTDEDAEDTSE